MSNINPFTVFHRTPRWHRDELFSFKRIRVLQTLFESLFNFRSDVRIVLACPVFFSISQFGTFGIILIRK